jgi:hypothetical protein
MIMANHHTVLKCRYRYLNGIYAVSVLYTYRYARAEAQIHLYMQV